MKPEDKCRECGDPLNPIEALVGGAGQGEDDEPICTDCVRKKHAEVTGEDR